MTDTDTPLKWAGGKSQLKEELLKRVPAKIRGYYEPMVGGAALFFALAKEKRFEYAVLGDLNPELVNFYCTLRDNHERLIEVASELAEDVSEAAFYKVRARFTSSQPPFKGSRVADRAACFLYLNKTCFNGLWRVNRSGAFNVPWGKYKKPTVVDAEKLRRCAELLQGVEIKVSDFEMLRHSSKRFGKRDFTYLDPPYLPLSATSNFAAYHSSGFGVPDTERLGLWCRYAQRQGWQFLVSSSDTPKTREIFAACHIESVQARRSINSQGSKRGAVGELLISPARKEKS